MLCEALGGRALRAEPRPGAQKDERTPEQRAIDTFLASFQDLSRANPSARSSTTRPNHERAHEPHHDEPTKRGHPMSPMLRPWTQVSMPHDDVRDNAAVKAEYAVNLGGVDRGEDQLIS